MPSIRVKLTAAYAGALVATTAAFGGALWVGRGVTKYRELQRYVSVEANVALRLIAQAQRAGDSVVVVRDSLVGATLAPRIAAALDAFPDQLVVLDTAGRALYLSPAAARLDPSALETLTRTSRRLNTDRLAALITLGGDEILVMARLGEGVLPPVERVVAGASTNAIALSGRELLGTMLVIAPFVLLLSVGGAYVIAGRAFLPVDRINNEVEAIT